MYQSQRPRFQASGQQPATSAPALKRARSRELVVVLLALAAAVALLSFFYSHNRDTAQTNNQARSGSTLASGFNKKQHSLSNPTSIWIIVNKPLALSPIDYVPGDLVTPSIPLRVPGNESMQLRREAASALETLAAQAQAAGFDLMLASGYRSYTYQVGLYTGYVKSMGQAEADKTSARPGHSEHQTGLAADLEPGNRTCELDACFGELPEGKWLAANAYKYGFVIRYPADKVAVTGYEYEPWHLRYVGKELAAELHQTGDTMEEFFGVRGGASFK